MPDLFGHDSNLKMAERQELTSKSCDMGAPNGSVRYREVQSPATSRSKPPALKTELRSEKNGGPEGTCTLSLPADNGLLRVFELRIRNW